LSTLVTVTQILRLCLLLGREEPFLSVFFVFQANVVSLDFLILLDSVSLQENLIIGQFIFITAQVAVIGYRDFGVVELLHFLVIENTG
jgi:hypothetical protein